MDDKLSTSPMHDKQNLPFVDLYQSLKCLLSTNLLEIIRDVNGHWQKKGTLPLLRIDKNIFFLCIH